MRFFLSFPGAEVDSSSSDSNSTSLSPETPPRENTTLRGLMKTPRIRGAEEGAEEEDVEDKGIDKEGVDKEGVEDEGVEDEDVVVEEEAIIM
jgi:hypothetical protein